MKGSVEAVQGSVGRSGEAPHAAGALAHRRVRLDSRGLHHALVRARAVSTAVAGCLESDRNGIAIGQ